jgi:hypothetical protein
VGRGDRKEGNGRARAEARGSGRDGVGLNMSSGKQLYRVWTRTVFVLLANVCAHAGLDAWVLERKGPSPIQSGGGHREPLMQ